MTDISGHPATTLQIRWLFSSFGENDPCIGVNFHLNDIQGRPPAWPVNALSIVKPEQRTMVSAHQNLGPIAGDVSRDKIQGYREMGATIDVGPYLIASPDDDDGAAC